MTFIRTAVGPNASNSLEVVRIADEADDRGPALVRWTAPFAPKAGNPLDGNFANPVVIMRAPYPIAFSYAGPDRTWREGWRGKAQLPRAVRVEVPGSSGRLLVSTSTVVRAELPALCAQPNVSDCAGGKVANRTTAARIRTTAAQIRSTAAASAALRGCEGEHDNAPSRAALRLAVLWMRLSERDRSSRRRHCHAHSALTDCTVHVVDTLPRPAVEATVVPFINQIAVSPPVSRHSRSLMPSPL